MCVPNPAVFDQKTQDNMKYNTVDGVFATASDNFAGPYLGLFALNLGATPSQIGLLNAFPALLGNLLQFPYALLTEKLGCRRRLIIIGSLGNRLSWLLLAFLPFLVPTHYAVPLIIILATMRVILGNLGVPAWTAIQAELIPKGVRGRYYSRRNFILNISGLITTFIASRIFRLSFPHSYQIVFVGATITGILSLVAFTRLKIRATPRNKSTMHSLGKQSAVTVRSMMQDNKEFKSYCFSSSIWSLGVTLSSSLFAIYYVSDLGGSSEWWSYVQAAGIIAGILCQKYWGSLVDGFGQKNIMVKSGIGVALVPLLWFLAPNPVIGIIVNFWSGFCWGGYNLAAFNLILEITPDENRSLYIGVYNALMGLTTALGPTLGGFLAEIAGLRLVFLLSFLGRLLGIFLLSRNVDSTGTRMQWKDLGKGFNRA